MKKNKSSKPTSTTNLVLEGDMTIQHVAEISESILKAFEKKGNLVLDMKNVESVDLAFVQLLHSTLKSARDIKKSVCLSADYPEVLDQAIAQAGFSKQMGDLIVRVEPEQTN